MANAPSPPGPGSNARPSAPGTVPLGEALDHSTPLASLMQRMQAAQQRRKALLPILPAELADAVRAGPLDDTHWTLLADSSAAAAKLRQLLPRLALALQDAGFAPLVLKVKVLPRQTTA